jgi:hypothetical protein
LPRVSLETTGETGQERPIFGESEKAGSDGWPSIGADGKIPTFDSIA